MPRVHIPILLPALAASACPLAAQESDGPWVVRTDVQGLVSRYEQTDLRDALRNVGVFLHADYFERGGFTLGYNRTALASADSAANTDQDSVFVSGRFPMTPDWASGRVTLRLDAYAISVDDPGGDGGDLDVIAPQLAYLNRARTFYADIGFTRSSYTGAAQGSQGSQAQAAAAELTVDQLTPTLGFGWNEQRDWLQLRAYLVDTSKAELAQGQADSGAVELKWTHWFTGRGFIGLDNFRWSVLAGERIFPVDPDAGVVYNLSDLQTGALTIGGEWRLGDRHRMLLLLGAERYENEPLGQDYRSALAYLNFTRQWK